MNINNTLPRVAIYVYSLIVLANCAPKEMNKTIMAQSVTQEQIIVPTIPATAIQDEIIKPTQTDFLDAQATPISSEFNVIGDGNFLSSEAPQHTVFDDDNLVMLNFTDTNILEFARVILGDLLKVNYFVDPKVSGSVTLRTVSGVPKAQLLSLLEEILARNNAIIDHKNDIYHILPRVGAIGIKRGGNNIGYRFDVVPLRYIAATEMEALLRSALPTLTNIRIDKLRNLLLINGATHEIATIEEMVSLFDVDWLQGMSMILYPLRHIDAQTAKQELEAIYNAFSDGKADTTLLRSVAIERLQSILLVSPNAKRIQQAKEWLQKLDRANEQYGQQLYVYRVQNAKAVDLANVLNNIFISQTVAPATNVQSSQPVLLAPQSTPTITATNDNSNAEQIVTPTPGPTIPSTGISLPLAQNIKIIADDTRNSLVILSAPHDYKMIKAAIEKLDLVPLQVLIEAQIIEVSLIDGLQHGVEWFLKHSITGNREGNLTFDLGKDAGVRLVVPSLSYSIVNNAKNLRLALNILSSKTNIKVLSSPSLMVLDNRTAKIIVGDEIPVPTRQSISNINPDAPTVNEIEFRNTGVSLEVTPRVSNSGLVTLEIAQEVSNAAATESSGVDAPTIQKRTIESVIAVNNHETIVLGGLINDRDNTVITGVPILKNIPLLGYLFRSHSQEERRTELLVLITPHVIYNSSQANAVTNEFRTKLQLLGLDKK